MTILLPGAALSTAPDTKTRNFSATAQTPAAATLTYITGTKVQIPDAGLKAGARYRAKFNMTKTAAGTASSQVDVVIGAAGTTADTARVSFTKPAGTAAADEGFVEVDVLVKSISATGVLVGEFRMGHNLAATGHATIPFVAVLTTSAGFDNRTLGGSFIGLCITTGASDAITITLVDAELMS